jgi:hypothetical protein
MSWIWFINVSPTGPGDENDDNFISMSTYSQKQMSIQIQAKLTTWLLKERGAFSGLNAKPDTDGQPYITIPHISQGFQNIFWTGCIELPVKGISGVTIRVIVSTMYVVIGWCFWLWTLYKAWSKHFPRVTCKSTFSVSSLMQKWVNPFLLISLFQGHTFYPCMAWLYKILSESEAFNCRQNPW